MGFVTNPEGVVPDSKCAECHPRNVHLMHAHLTDVGRAKTRELTQGMVNLAVDCFRDEKGSIVCRPSPEADCFHCHAVSVTASTLSLIDVAKMKSGHRKDEMLGHGCITCHPPRGARNHHLTGNVQSITIRAAKAFQRGCGGCHGQGLKKLTSGGSPHDWLAKHLHGLPKGDKTEAR